MIQVNALNKKYGTLQALSSVDVEIGPGRVTAILGPNGAGKTTLIKSILGLVKPDSGTITMDGIRVNGESRYREKIGYMPQLARYPENLTVTEIVEMIRDIRKASYRYEGRFDSNRVISCQSGSAISGSAGSCQSGSAESGSARFCKSESAISGSARSCQFESVHPHTSHSKIRTVEGSISSKKGTGRPGENGQTARIQELPKDDSPDLELWERFGLDSEKNKAFRTLSGGNRQKVSAMLAFLFRPKVLILDEPTTGLDPVSSSILKDKILKERDRGTTIILTSHIMSEVQELAEQVVYLLDGKIYFERSVAGLIEETDQSTLERAIAVKLGRRHELSAEKGGAS